MLLNFMNKLLDILNMKNYTKNSKTVYRKQDFQIDSKYYKSPKAPKTTLKKFNNFFPIPVKVLFVLFNIIMIYNFNNLMEGNNFFTFLLLYLLLTFILCAPTLIVCKIIIFFYSLIKKKTKLQITEPIKEKVNPQIVEPSKDNIIFQADKPLKEDIVTQVDKSLEDIIPQVDESFNEDLISQTVEPFNEDIVPQIVEPFNEDIISQTDETLKEKDTITPYRSSRIIIKGVHTQFIDIAREIVEQQQVCTIPLMREYNLDLNQLNRILKEIQLANIIDDNNNVLMDSLNLEQFIDVYEPVQYTCPHGEFDKEIFMCIGEIIFDSGIPATYDCLDAEEILDYLNIMENLGILSYDSNANTYNICSSKNKFYTICENIPDIYCNKNSNKYKTKHTNVDYNSMTGIEFENFCSYLLTKNGFINVTVTPPSGDHGIDILAEKDTVSYAIQCKCYSSPIGNAAVQQAHTGKSLYKKDIAVVLTNNTFTQQAIDEANELGIKLWDRTKLDEFIDSTKEQL